MFLIGVSLIAGEESKTKETPQKIDAQTLLIELEGMMKDIPATKEGCQRLLENISKWEKEKRASLQKQATHPKYGFECGWIPQDYEDSRACTQVLLSEEKAMQGHYSLKMMMDLVGGDKHKSKGEAWVNTLENPPVGEHIPVNLQGRTVTAWVYAPAGARGKWNKPNGFQIFVKDKDYKSEYGPWHNVTEEDWFKISLKVSPFAPENGSMDAGFDPGQIIAIGVKMGAGDGSTAMYKGHVFIDGIDW